MIDSKSTKIEELTVRVKLKKSTIGLFSVPLPRCQQVMSFKNPTVVRILDNPLEESLRHYAAWGRVNLPESSDSATDGTEMVIR